MNDNKEKRDMSARDIWREKNKKGCGSDKETGNCCGSEVHNNDYSQEHSYIGIGGESFTAAGNKRRKYNKSLVIFIAILAGLFLIGLLFKFSGINWVMSDGIKNASKIGEKHIGVLYIEGTIGGSDGQYNHQYVLDTLDGMIRNKNNRGLMLYVNTPGGSVYESDEVYSKIKEYQEKTGRPVYSYMASQATSGGYYISAPSDKIIANRNCWTGSIGVTMGTLFDISGLLEKYGIKSETVTSGANKSMGSMTEPVTEQQRQIMQSMVDEAYEQFVGIVAEGRALNVDYVKSISDGRIYTAAQAKDIKLVDEVVQTYDDALEKMEKECGLYECEIYNFRYEKEEGLLTDFIKSIDKLAESGKTNSDISALIQLMEKQNQIPLQYMCEVIK